MNIDEIGSAIRERRQRLGMTQNQLALYSDLSRTSITNLEMGNQYPSLATLHKIARVLGCALTIELTPKKEQ